MLDWSSIIEYVWQQCLPNSTAMCAASDISCSRWTYLLKDSSVHCINVSDWGLWLNRSLQHFMAGWSLIVATCYVCSGESGSGKSYLCEKLMVEILKREKVTAIWTKELFKVTISSLWYQWFIIPCRMSLPLWLCWRHWGVPRLTRTKTLAELWV